MGFSPSLWKEMVGTWGLEPPDLYRVKAHLFNPFNNLNHRLGPPKPFEIRARRQFNGLKNGLENEYWIGRGPAQRLPGVIPWNRQRG